MKEETKSTQLLNLDLQFFADGGEGGTEPNQASGSAGNAEPQTFTQEDLDKLISARLGEEQAKWEKDYAAKIEEAKTEAEKLAKMKAEEKAAYQKEKQLKELEAREKAIVMRELKAQAIDSLVEKDLPKELIDCLNLTTAESCSQSLTTIEKAFKAAVEAQTEKIVNERLRGGSPLRVGMASSNDAIEKQIAKAMGLKQ